MYGYHLNTLLSFKENVYDKENGYNKSMWKRQLLGKFLIYVNHVDVK